MDTYQVEIEMTHSVSRAFFSMADETELRDITCVHSISSQCDKFRLAWMYLTIVSRTSSVSDSGPVIGIGGVTASCSVLNKYRQDFQSLLKKIPYPGSPNLDLFMFPALFADSL
jgi:hypothetical protein